MVEKILIPRRSREERNKNWLIESNKLIKQYIKGGCKGDLWLVGTPITSLPANLIVGGSLSLFDSQISTLPSGLNVMKHLNIINTQIESLPPDLIVGGDFWVNFTPLANKYSGVQIKQMAPGIKGYVKGASFIGEKGMHF